MPEEGQQVCILNHFAPMVWWNFGGFDKVTIYIMFNPK